MTRVQGCNTSAADLGCRDALVGPSRRLGCKCLKKRRRAGCLSSQAFRANRPTEFSPEAPKGASRLLKSRRAGSLPVEQAEKAYLRARQRDRVADHAQQSPTKRAPGRLLQRNNADREPAEVDKQRQQARDRQQALDKEQDSDQNLLVSRQRASNRQKVPDTQQSSSTSVSLHLQETQSSDQQNAKPPGKRYSQAAGKLSRKDWQVTVSASVLRIAISSTAFGFSTDIVLLLEQVTTEWLSMDMQDGLLDETIWKDLLTDCDLEPWYRPQVRLTCSVVMCHVELSFIGYQLALNCQSDVKDSDVFTASTQTGSTSNALPMGYCSCRPQCTIS